MVKKPQAKTAPWRPTHEKYEDYYAAATSSPQSWQWWRGSWSARASRGGQTAAPAREERYDQIAVAKASQRPPARLTTETEAPGSQVQVLQAVQRSVTHARKMDAKIRKLQEDRRVKALQWDAYAADTKEKFLRQRRAYEQDIQRIEQEMAQATIAGQEAAERVKELVNKGAAAIHDKDTTMDPSSWEALLASEANDAGVFLAQALQAAGGGLAPPSARQLRPEVLQQLFGSTSLPQFGLSGLGTAGPPQAVPPVPAPDLYTATQPPGLETRDAQTEPFATASPKPTASVPSEPMAPTARPAPLERGVHGTSPHHPGQREAGVPRQPTSMEAPRQDIKTASMKPQGTVPMSGPSLGEKLDQKREAERRTAMQPFGGCGRPTDKPPGEGVPAGGDVKSTAFVDDDPDLQAPVSPGFLGME